MLFWFFYTITSSVKIQNLVSSFQYLLLIFPTELTFLVLALWFWVEVTLVGILFLFLTSKGKPSKFIIIKSDIWWSFFLWIQALYYIKKVSLYSQITRFFISINEIISNFFCKYWGNHIIFLHDFLNVVKYTNWLSNVTPTLLSWSKPKLGMWCIEY